ncbi:MAG TPA: (Fe-S)-binding protein [Bryobacteraceae bacterium]|jgi:L-lactate dehydrogenase complex protein LldE|nr:(Fe-S)-binding protein [Bryobacteraceae bacterium]
MRISLFITCYNDLLFPDTGIAVVNLLERLGHSVIFRSAQTCCGQMHYNTGYQRETIPLVRKFADIFRDDEIIVCPSSSCVAMIRDHYEKVALLADDATLVAKVKEIVPRVFEFTELLTDRFELEDVGAYYPHKVAYHPSCHGLRMLRLGDRPIRLLRHVEGIELVDLLNSTECCGFGGTFAVKNAETSSAMLQDKIRCILDTGAEVCTAADNSCLMHIFGGLHRQKQPVKTVHLAQILAATRKYAQ